MPIVGYFMRNERDVHYGSGYSSGPVRTITHNLTPAADVSVHTAISAVQATTGGPLGAAIGILRFGNMSYGLNPADWPSQVGGVVSSFTTASQIAKGEMNVSTHFHFWN